jgi:Na+-driven multidrug efflux pump
MQQSPSSTCSTAGGTTRQVVVVVETTRATRTTRATSSSSSSSSFSWWTTPTITSMIVIFVACHDVVISHAGAFAVTSSWSYSSVLSSPLPQPRRRPPAATSTAIVLIRGGGGGGGGGSGAASCINSSTSSSTNSGSSSGSGSSGRSSSRKITSSLAASASVTAAADDAASSSHSAPPRGGGARRGDTAMLPLEPPARPTIAQYQKFALPCLALWIAGPLLSLVDTAFVGLSGSSDQSARQLAALGPATTFFDGATYLFAFLNVATTNLYSSARAKSGERSVEAESVVRTAARVATNCGIGLLFFLLVTSRPLLRLYIGSRAADTPGLLDAAADYVAIRSLSMPTTLLLGVLQAALLGAKDSVTPLIAILYSTVVNVIGDYILVSRCKMGLQGAAIATTVAQWASTLALLGPARRRLLSSSTNPSLDLWKPKPKMDANGDPVAVAEGHVSGRAFLSFAAPVLTLILGKLAAFGFMTNAAAGVPGQPTPLAAHQIVLSLLFFCSPFLEVISQTAQTFLPPFLAPVYEHMNQQKAINPDYDSKKDVRATAWFTASHHVGTRLLGLSLVTALGIAGIASLVPAFFGNIITSDKTVQMAVKPLARQLFFGTLFWAPVAVSEGILLARRELSFLASVYLVSTALLPPALLMVKFRDGDVGQVWSCFVVFQIFRAICFTMRIWGPGLWQRMGIMKKKSTTGSSNTINAEASSSSTTNAANAPEIPPPP